MKKYIIPSITIITTIILSSICGFILGLETTKTKPQQPITTQLSITQIIITQIKPTDRPTYTNPPPTIIIITTTPQPTQLANSATINMTADHPPGIYLVNIDIAPGIWRNNGNSDQCYWSITNRTGEIIENFIGQTGGTIYIPPNAFQVELTPKCGTWTYLSPP